MPQRVSSLPGRRVSPGRISWPRGQGSGSAGKCARGGVLAREGGDRRPAQRGRVRWGAFSGATAALVAWSSVPMPHSCFRQGGWRGKRASKAPANGQRNRETTPGNDTGTENESATDNARASNGIEQDVEGTRGTGSTKYTGLPAAPTTRTGSLEYSEWHAHWVCGDACSPGRARVETGTQRRATGSPRETFRRAQRGALLRGGIDLKTPRACL